MVSRPTCVSHTLRILSLHEQLAPLRRLGSPRAVADDAGQRRGWGKSRPPPLFRASAMPLRAACSGIQTNRPGHTDLPSC